jgi:hypothetical protein
LNFIPQARPAEARRCTEALRRAGEFAFLREPERHGFCGSVPAVDRRKLCNGRSLEIRMTL